MNRTRRVGGFTLGVSLIAFGLLFLCQTIIGNLPYDTIIKFWPCILILLGIEVLVSYVINKEEEYKYDGFSIFILIGMSLFSMVMAGIEMIIKHAEFVIGR